MKSYEIINIQWHSMNWTSLKQRLIPWTLNIPWAFSPQERSDWQSWGYVWSRAFSAIMKQSMWVLKACHVQIWSQEATSWKQVEFTKVISVHMSWSSQRFIHLFRSPSTTSPGDETSSPRDERPFDGLSRKGEAGPSMRTLKVSRLTSNSFPKVTWRLKFEFCTTL